MSFYTKALEFFIENDIQLSQDQIKLLYEKGVGNNHYIYQGEQEYDEKHATGKAPKERPESQVEKDKREADEKLKRDIEKELNPETDDGYSFEENDDEDD